jgi:hypothetical protein
LRSECAVRKAVGRERETERVREKREREHRLG